MTTPHSIGCDLSGADFSPQSKEFRVARLRGLGAKVASVMAVASSSRRCIPRKANVCEPAEQEECARASS